MQAINYDENSANQMDGPACSQPPSPNVGLEGAGTVFTTSSCTTTSSTPKFSDYFQNPWAESEPFSGEAIDGFTTNHQPLSTAASIADTPLAPQGSVSNSLDYWPDFNGNDSLALSAGQVVGYQNSGSGVGPFDPQGSVTGMLDYWPDFSGDDSFVLYNSNPLDYQDDMTLPSNPTQMGLQNMDGQYLGREFSDVGYLPGTLAFDPDWNNGVARNLQPVTNRRDPASAAGTSVHPCSQVGCPATFKRPYERARHEATAHGINQIVHLCPVAGCVKSQGTGYSRADKVKEHLWRKHANLGYTKSR